jgi:hypothetical protein
MNRQVKDTAKCNAPRLGCMKLSEKMEQTQTPHSNHATHQLASRLSYEVSQLERTPRPSESS